MFKNSKGLKINVFPLKGNFETCFFIFVFQIERNLCMKLIIIHHQMLGLLIL